MWIVYYYFCSVFAGIYNKELVKAHGVSPPVLTLAHLVFSACADGACVRRRGGGTRGPRVG
jgi:hypothetical protein